METRKIQLIAGTTYTISLPKEWIRKNNLKEKDEIHFRENNDRSLILTNDRGTAKKLDAIALDLDEYSSNIDQVLFAVYYLGVETVEIFSKKEIEKRIRSKIRKTITHMSGTEISYEDKKKIVIKVLLAKSRVDVIQLLYRMSLIIDSSIQCIVDDFDIDEIRMNENEIDRLYHLMAKIIATSLIDTSILLSSKVCNVSLIPSYFLISKRLENIADIINDVSLILVEYETFEYKKEIMEFLRVELKRSITCILKYKDKLFDKVDKKNIDIIIKKIDKIKDRTIRGYLDDAVRFVIDIEEEIVNIGFYNSLIKKKLL